ncbi:hypothetical protein [Gordonia alkaliphila]|uniref:Uncharacterized protein n=1 Tax=Gordonia alkaliphila TaxID=1053547 RepID=A0ABP8ZGR8_9ACTN
MTEEDQQLDTEPVVDEVRQKDPGPSAPTGEEVTDDLEKPDDEPETFPREYVEKLRQENGKYRQRAQQADDLAQRLHTALVAADGRLQDPTDLAFDPSHLDDGNLTAAIDGLIERKPHLAARRIVGDVGQGATTTAGEVDLLGILGGR